MEDSNCKGFIGKKNSYQKFSIRLALNELIRFVVIFCFCVDLAEVQSVAAAPPAQVGTKKIDERAFFDVSSTTASRLQYRHNWQNTTFYFQLKTSRRTYNFYAVEANMAQEWIEKIQACLQ